MGNQGPEILTDLVRGNTVAAPGLYILSPALPHLPPTMVTFCVPPTAIVPFGTSSQSVEKNKDISLWGPILRGSEQG